MIGELRNSRAKLYKKAVLSQGELRNAAVNFDTYHIFHVTAWLSCWVAHWASMLGVPAGIHHTGKVSKPW